MFVKRTLSQHKSSRSKNMTFQLNLDVFENARIAEILYLQISTSYKEGKIKTRCCQIGGKITQKMVAKDFKSNELLIKNDVLVNISGILIKIIFKMFLKTR